MTWWWSFLLGLAGGLAGGVASLGIVGVLVYTGLRTRFKRNAQP